MSAGRYATTENRSLLGIMNEFRYLADAHRDSQSWWGTLAGKRAAGPVGVSRLRRSQESLRGLAFDLMRMVRFRRAYAVEVEGEIVGFARGPQRWDAYLVDGGLIAVGLPSREAAGERIVEAATSSPPNSGMEK